MTTRDPEAHRRATAFHEAGHAVYGLQLNPGKLVLLEATILHGVIAPGKEYRGRCCWDGERSARQQIELLAAGPEGEEYSGDSQSLDGSNLWIMPDDEQIEMHNIAKRLLGRDDDDSARQQFILPAQERVRQAFLAPALQRQLVAIAMALLEYETLTGVQVAAIIGST